MYELNGETRGSHQHGVSEKRLRYGIQWLLFPQAAFSLA
jgi:hypothetical protein